MKTYTVYFEIYGIKKRVKIQAQSKEMAQRIVLNDLKIVKVEEENQQPYSEWKEVNDISEMLGIKTK